MLKFYSRYRLSLLTIVIFYIAGCSGFSGPKYDFISIAKIDSTSHGHSTTRQFQRKVFFVNDHWYIFYSNGVDCLYKSSKDGVSWSKPGIIDKGSAGSSNMDVIYNGNFFFYFNSVDEDPRPKKYKMVLYARKGIIQSQSIKWGELYRVFKDIGVDEDAFYSSVSIDTNGYFWVASRHSQAPDKFNDVVVTRSLDPFNIKTWTSKELGLKTTDLKSIAPQIMGLGDGRAFLIGKATDKKKFFGNYYDGAMWREKDILIANGSKVWGDDRRMSMVFEPGSNSRKDRVHLVYIDEKHYLRYRVFSAPYEEQDWNPPLDQPGELVVKNSNELPIKTFSGVLAIDRSRQPAWLYLLYGATKFQGKDQRHAMGELRLIRYAKGNWSNRSLLMSENRTKFNWYPSMIESAEKKIGVLYLKNYKANWDIMFSSADKAEIDKYFETAFQK